MDVYNMGTLKTRKKEYVGEMRKPKSGKNDIWTFQTTKSGIKKIIPIRRND